jgi:hypothetical protein
MENVKKFNWALLIGCGIIALSLSNAMLTSAAIIGSHISSANGAFHGSLVGSNSEQREFMSDWEAAIFLSIGEGDLIALAESGELNGTFTTFQVERQKWHTVEPYRSGDVIVQMIPQEVEVTYETVTTDQRVFSRRLLEAWLLSRIMNLEFPPE